MMAKGKRKDEATVKDDGSAGEKAAGKAKGGGRKKVEAVKPVVEVKAEPAKGKKAVGRKKAEAAEPVVEVKAEPAKGKKAVGRKKAEAAEPVAEVKAEPVKGKKAVGRKKAEAEPVAEVKAEPAKGKKKAGGKKPSKAEPVAEAAAEPAKGKKKAGGKKTSKAEPAVEAAPEPAKGKKKADKAKTADKPEKKAGKSKTADKPEEKAGKSKTADEPEKKAGKSKAANEPAKKADKKSTKKKAGKGSKPKKPAGPTLAERQDKHTLYQLSVQSPEADIEFFVERYKELRGREPKVLREDFCGTAYISATWAGSGKNRRAIGVDLDTATLQWAREHNLAPLSDDARKRVDLRQANVLDGGGKKADITCAMNFSYGVFKTRAELKHYFEVVFQQLADDGVFVTELYGGTEAIVAVQDEREIEGNEATGGDFTYYWEQAAYNPITHETLCHIHFELSDRSKIEKAFSYDWRLWSIAEVRELLYEVGFTSVRVYWESTDDDGDGTGEYHPSEEEENQEAWLVYLVAAK
jgi:hypothetical protein